MWVWVNWKHIVPADQRQLFLLQAGRLDAYEDSYRQPGTVFLVGKVWVPSANAHVRYVCM